MQHLRINISRQTQNSYGFCCHASLCPVCTGKVRTEVSGQTKSYAVYFMWQDLPKQSPKNFQHRCNHITIKSQWILDMGAAQAQVQSDYPTLFLHGQPKPGTAPRDAGSTLSFCSNDLTRNHNLKGQFREVDLAHFSSSVYHQAQRWLLTSNPVNRWSYFLWVSVADSFSFWRKPFCLQHMPCICGTQLFSGKIHNHCSLSHLK